MIDRIIDTLFDINMRVVIIIGIVLVLRMLLTSMNISRKYVSLLWILPYLCLVMPWRAESDISLWSVFPQFEMQIMDEPIEHEADTSGDEEIHSGMVISGSEDIQNGMVISGNEEIQNYLQTEKTQDNTVASNITDKMPADTVTFEGIIKSADDSSPAGIVKQTETASIVMFAVWLSGLAIVAIYSLISYVRLRRKIICSYCVRDNIYYVDDIETPFVFGIIRPRIYIPSLINPEDMRYVLEHEQTHILRKDHLKKIVAYMISVIHWFNPVVWVAFYSFGKDIEMTCDEETIWRIGMENKQNYARVLLKMAAGEKRLKSVGVPVAFGEGDTKSRIKNILKYKRTVKVVALGAVAVIAVLCAVLLTDPKSEQTVPESSEQITTMSPEVSESTVGAVDSPQNIEIEVTDATIAGPDGPILDYASEDMIIFHDWYGLFVYHREKGMMASVDLESVGLAATQGDNACEVLVSKDGLHVYMFMMKERKHMYVYDVEQGKLYKQEYDISGVDVFTCNRYDGEFDYLNYMENANVKHYLESEDGKPINLRWKAVDRNTQETKWDIALFNSSEINQFTMETLTDIFRYVEIDLPDGVKLGAYERLSNDIWNGCLFEGDFEELPHGEACPKAWYGAGGIGMVKKEVYDVATFKNDKLEDVTVLTNHGGRVSEFETVEGCDMQAIIAEHAYQAFVGPEEEEYMKKHGLTKKQMKEIEAIRYWYIYLAEPTSENVYLLYLNKHHFSKEEAIAIAKTMVIKESYVNYHRTNDGMWETDDGYTYKYRLKISGHLPKAAKDSTYIILSNTKDITFEQAWKAGGLSSNSEDYFEPEEAVVVERR